MPSDRLTYSIICRPYRANCRVVHLQQNIRPGQNLLFCFVLFCFAVKFNHKFLMMILIQSINHLKWTERILYEIKMIDVE